MTTFINVTACQTLPSLLVLLTDLKNRLVIPLLFLTLPILQMRKGSQSEIIWLNYSYLPSQWHRDDLDPKGQMLESDFSLTIHLWAEVENYFNNIGRIYRINRFYYIDSYFFIENELFSHIIYILITVSPCSTPPRSSLYRTPPHPGSTPFLSLARKE